MLDSSVSNTTFQVLACDLPRFFQILQGTLKEVIKVVVENKIW